MRYSFAASSLALAVVTAATLPSEGRADTLLLKTEVVYGKILSESPSGYSVRVSCKNQPVVIARTEVSSVTRNSQCGPAKGYLVMQEFRLNGVVTVEAWAKGGTAADSKAFEFVDRDHDGKLTTGELDSVIGRRMPNTVYTAERLF
jgi:hypothetical protein